MKITSILSATAIVLAAAASQSVEASGVQAVHCANNGAVHTAVTAADVAQARQKLAGLVQRNHNEAETNAAQRYAQWLREQAAAASHPTKQPSRHPHKQPASVEGSDSGSGSGISAHHAGRPHPHPHKQYKEHKDHGRHHHFHHSSSGSSSGSGNFVVEVAAPHATATPASTHHLNKKHEHPTKHETAELHTASGSSSVDVD